MIELCQKSFYFRVSMKRRFSGNSAWEHWICVLQRESSILKKKKKIEEWQDLLLKANFLLRIGSCAKREIHSVARSYPTLCDTMDYTPPRSHVHGISRARILEWVAIPFSRGSYRPKDQTWGLLHCREILYHLSHQGNPFKKNKKQRRIECLTTISRAPSGGTNLTFSRRNLNSRKQVSTSQGSKAVLLLYSSNILRKHCRTKQNL